VLPRLLLTQSGHHHEARSSSGVLVISPSSITS